MAENVPALRVRGANRVLADLEVAGYTRWLLMVGAAHAGARNSESGYSFWASRWRANGAPGQPHSKPDADLAS